MEDSDKELASPESTDEANRAPTAMATGRIDLKYTKADGAIERWSLIHFNLSTQYDEGNRIWRSEGYADSDRRSRYVMEATYDVFKRLLTITLQHYVFSAPGTHMQATTYNDRSTLNISFLKDVEAHTDIIGDQYLIKSTSRLNLSL